MHQQLCNSKQEKGAILPLAAVVIFVLFLLVGVVIDAGNLYRSRTALQNIADSAALAGIGYITMRGRADFEKEANGGVEPSQPLSDKHISDYLRPKIQKVIDANIVRSGIDLDLSTPPTLDSEINQYDSSSCADSAYIYSAEISGRVRLYLLHLLPLKSFGLGSVGRDRVLTVRATARRAIANVLIALDLYYSMRCPAEDTGRDCSCLTPERQAGGCGAKGELKIDRLIDAAGTFVKRFDIGTDNLIFSVFNSAALTFSTEDFLKLGERMDSHNVEALLQKLRDTYEPSGFTNMCDALMEGYQRVNTFAKGNPVSVLVFSDGAPTGGSFYFANPKPSFATAANAPHVSYSMQWINSTSDNAGPSKLVKRGEYPNGLTFGFKDIEPPTASDVPACSDSRAVDNSQESKSAAVNASFSNCLNDLSFSLPWDPRIVGGDYSPAQKGFLRWREQYYNCAIHISDSIRENNGRVYSIGLGQAAAKSIDQYSDQQPPPFDPYQNVDDPFSRKDFFLARVANDRIRAITGPDKAGTDRYPDFHYQVKDGDEIFTTKTYEDWASDSDSREGVYLSTPNDNFLGQLFEKIARKIQMSLIS